MSHGWIYELHIAETEFTAKGLDAAHRVARRLNDVVKEALERDPEVIEILGGPHFREKGSTKNFLQSSPKTGGTDGKV